MDEKVGGGGKEKEEVLALPAPGDEAKGEDGKSSSGSVVVGGEPVKFDKLGPVVVSGMYVL